VALAGWLVARQMYLKNPETAPALAARFPRLHALLYDKYRVDELYDAMIVEPAKRFGTAFNRFDDGVIDGTVRAVAGMTQGGAAVSTAIEKYVIYGFLNIIGYLNHIAAALFRRLQSGQVHHYAAIIVVGVFILINLYLWFFDHSAMTHILGRLALKSGN